jgi:hypothetical protein
MLDICKYETDLQILCLGRDDAVPTEDFYLFLVCLTKLCVGVFTHRRMMGWLMNNELASMWKEAVVAYC